MTPFRERNPVVIGAISLVALAALLLEPDSDTGYVAHRLLALDAGDHVPILRIIDGPDTHVVALHPLQ